MLVPMPIASASASSAGARRQLVGALRDAVDVADQRADRRRDPARDQHAEDQPAERSDQAGDRALAEKQPADLSARRAERAQDADLRSPLRHGDRERVVDDEHPDEEREEARDARPSSNRRRASPRTAGRGPTAARPGSPDRAAAPSSCSASAIVRPVLDREVDAIELAAAPEHLLRGVDVHDREVAAERARQPGRLHDAADRELLLAFGRAEREPAADRELVLVGELLREDDRVGLREKDQRIVDRPPRRRSRGRSRAGCDRRSCRRRGSAGCPAAAIDGSCRRPLRSPARRRGPSTRACTLSSTSSSKPVSPAVTCSSVLPAMRSTVRENANSTL